MSPYGDGGREGPKGSRDEERTGEEEYGFQDGKMGMRTEGREYTYIHAHHPVPTYLRIS